MAYIGVGRNVWKLAENSVAFIIENYWQKPSSFPSTGCKSQCNHSSKTANMIMSSAKEFYFSRAQNTLRPTALATSSTHEPWN
jgi:hypothetical protein